MSLIDSNSLANTIDNVNEALFFDKQISELDKLEVAKWLANRQGLSGCYANMFAPTEYDTKNGIHLFTGDRLPQSASLRHVLGEETCRVLRLLNVDDAEVRAALQRASNGMVSAVKHELKLGSTSGWFCCGRCTPAYWRHISAGGFDNPEQRISDGMKILAKHRNDNGSWSRFPFYWTVLALSEMDSVFIKDEVSYIAPKLERIAKKKASDDKYAIRRKALAERVLNKF